MADQKINGTSGRNDGNLGFEGGRLRTAHGGRIGELARAGQEYNFAWLQYLRHQMEPNGTAGVVLADGPMSSSQSGGGNIDPGHVDFDRLP